MHEEDSGTMAPMFWVSEAQNGRPNPELHPGPTEEGVRRMMETRSQKLRGSQCHRGMY